MRWKSLLALGVLGGLLGGASYMLLFTPLNFITFMAYGILKGAVHATKFDVVDAQVVELDRRCSNSGVYKFSEMAPNSCSEIDLVTRKATLERPPPEPVKDGIVTHYPGKEAPQPGFAIAMIRYTGSDGIARTVEARADTSDHLFYEWRKGAATKIGVCRSNPAIYRLSILDLTKC